MAKKGMAEIKILGKKRLSWGGRQEVKDLRGWIMGWIMCMDIEVTKNYNRVRCTGVSDNMPATETCKE